MIDCNLTLKRYPIAECRGILGEVRITQVIPKGPKTYSLQLCSKTAVNFKIDTNGYYGVHGGYEMITEIAYKSLMKWIYIHKKYMKC